MIQTAERIRDCGFPDFLNRWLMMLEKENMVAIGPKEQALRDARRITARSAKPAESAAKAAQQEVPMETQTTESVVSKTKKTAKSKKPARAKSRTTVKPEAKTNGIRAGSKLEIIVGLLKRPEGCTMAEVTEAVGWKTMSFPQQAKAAGLTLKKEKDGSVTRYRAA